MRALKGGVYLCGDGLRRWRNPRERVEQSENDMASALDGQRGDDGESKHAGTYGSPPSFRASSAQTRCSSKTAHSRPDQESREQEKRVQAEVVDRCEVTGGSAANGAGNDLGSVGQHRASQHETVEGQPRSSEETSATNPLTPEKDCGGDRQSDDDEHNDEIS